MSSENEHIDRYLKESLGSYKPRPSAGAWNGISRRLIPIGAIQFLRYYRFGIAAVILLALLITGVWKYYDNQALPGKPELNTPVVKQEPVPSRKTDTKPLMEDRQSVPADNKQNEHSPENNEAPVVNKSQSARYEENKTQEFSGKKHPEPITPEALLKEEPAITLPFPSSLRMIFLDKLPSDKILPEPGKVGYPFSLASSGTVRASGLFRGSDKIFSLHVISELIKKDNSFNFGYGLEVTGSVTGRDYLLETGIGIRHTYDNGDYRVDYSQYDSTGFYYKVTSFTIDPVSGDPIFNTTPEVVYDTIGYQSDISTNNRFTYLKIPFNAGIRVAEYKRFTIWLKAGASWAVKTNSQIPEPGFSNSKALYYTIQNQTPSRISSYWQLNTSLGLWYAAGSKVGIHIEPVYQVYLDPVYDRRFNVKSPYSVGLRAGVHFKI